MGFLGNTERIVTRALAIGFIAVVAGAAHTWVRGSLNPKPMRPAPTNGAQAAPGSEGQTPPENAVATPDEPGNQPPAEQAPAQTEPQEAPLPEGHITTAEAFEFWNSGEAVFIDTRLQEEFEAGHVMGAINLSLEMTRDIPAFQNVLQNQIPDTTIPLVLYCVGGLCDESEYVGRILRDAGFTRVYIMHDGYPAWTAAEHPTETGPGE